MASVIAIIVPDLMFQPSIRAAAEAIGLEAAIADTPDLARTAIAAHPAIVAIDLQGAGIDALALIREAKADGAAVLAFGQHTAAATLRGAREAGADIAVPRSQLVEELPQLLRSLFASRAESHRP